MKLERCCECDYPTGRAGRHDDSIYLGDYGPFCEECYDRLGEKFFEMQNRISRLEALESAVWKMLDAGEWRRVTPSLHSIGHEIMSDVKEDKALIEAVRKGL